MARQLGVTSIATTRTSAKRPLLESLQPDHIIVTGEEDIVKRVKQITGGLGVDFVRDGVGGKDFPKLVDATAPQLRGLLYYHAAVDEATNTIVNVRSGKAWKQPSRWTRCSRCLPNAPILEAAGVQFDKIANYEPAWKVEGTWAFRPLSAVPVPPGGDHPATQETEDIDMTLKSTVKAASASLKNSMQTRERAMIQ